MQAKAATLSFVILTGVEGSRLQQTFREMHYRRLSVCSSLPPATLPPQYPPSVQLRHAPGVFSKADARLATFNGVSGTVTPEAPHTIFDALTTLDHLPFGIHGRGEYEYVGHKFLDEGNPDHPGQYEAIPVGETRLALVRPFLDGLLELGLNGLVARGYSGLTTETFDPAWSVAAHATALPYCAPGSGPSGLPNDFDCGTVERSVGIRMASYVGGWVDFLALPLCSVESESEDYLSGVNLMATQYEAELVHRSIKAEYLEGNMSKSLIDEVVAASPNRRNFLKTIGAATAGVTALSVAGITPALGQSATEVEVLKFALNLEYLESEFYTYALYGQGIELFGIGVSGSANGSNSPGGMVTSGGKKVAFGSGNAITLEIAEQLGSDERAHVALLRTALGSEVIAKPTINLDALGFGFGSVDEFLRLSRIFEDIGVSAYGGAAGLLTTPAIITVAARILAAEAEHVSAIRTQIIHLGVTTSALDGADLIPPPSGKLPLSINPKNGMPAIRTPGEVLFLAFGGKANATKGGFFPDGVNGAITMSTEAATASNLA